MKSSCLSLHLCLAFFFLSVLTTNASVEVIGSLRQVYNTKPGEVVKGQILIQNSDSADQEVRIYQTDYLYNYKEQTYYDEPGKNPRSNADWITYSPKTVVLRAKEARNLEYEIRVPASDSAIGTYWSVVMVEGVFPIDPAATQGLSIRTVTRYAVQLVNEMTNKGKGNLRFAEPTLVKGEESKLFLAVDLFNEGTYFISPEVSMEVYDNTGNLVKTIKADKKGLYPTTSSRFKLDLAGLPAKKTYTAMIVAAGQGDDVFGMEYTLYF